MILAAEVGRYNASYVAQYREQVIYGGCGNRNRHQQLTVCPVVQLYPQMQKGEISGRAVWLFLFFDKVVKRIFRGIKNIALHIYDNAGNLARALFLFGGIMAYNSLAGIILSRTRNDGVFVLRFIIFVLVPDAPAVYGCYYNRNKKKELIEGIREISEGNLNYQIDTRKLHGENLDIAQAINSISVKHQCCGGNLHEEGRKAEGRPDYQCFPRHQNASDVHYQLRGFIKAGENIETQPVKGYIEVLDQKSQRLKHLTEDLVEASKISSGNIVLHMEKIDLTELLHQTVAEFSR